MQELIKAIESLNAFSWADAVAILSLLASWIAIIFLLKERSDSNRPYLQVTFELVRSTLACIVIRNTGNVPLTIKKINFGEDFIKQLPDPEKNNIKKYSANSINIFPGKQWVICLGVIIPEILEKYDNKILKINYAYSKINKNKLYNETTKIDFEQYSGFLVYISEIDELREVNSKMAKDINNLNKEVEKISANVVKFHNISDKYMRNIVTGFEKDNE
ncbi:MAG: hypothetical protein PHX03_02540 [Bacilli bacterium]|nr:hypothetical protein [Bacilli bacterium]